MGAFAIVIVLFSATVTVIDGIIAIWTTWNAKQIQTIQERCRKNKYAIGRGELCLWLWKNLFQNSYQNDTRDDDHYA